MSGEKLNTKLYDKTGREIKIGDLLKIFHFVGARRKRHFMYQQVVEETHTADGLSWLKVDYLNLSGATYMVLCDERVRKDYEIIQSVKCDHHDRPRLPECR